MGHLRRVPKTHLPTHKESVVWDFGGISLFLICSPFLLYSRGSKLFCVNE